MHKRRRASSYVIVNRLTASSYWSSKINYLVIILDYFFLSFDLGEMSEKYLFSPANPVRFAGAKANYI
jgi:hypothetical protein